MPVDIKAILQMNADFCMTKEDAFNSPKTLAFFPDTQGNLYKRIISPLGVCVEKVSTLPFGEANVKLGMNFKLPKLPLMLLAQVVSFFRDICTDTRDEVFVRIYMNKETQEYKIVCPKQTVTATSVDYKIEDETLETDYEAIMDIHSHDTMGAFFSGTDDKDERTPGRLYMVLGKLDTHAIEYKLRTFVDGHVEVDFFEVWERPNVTVESEIPLNIPVKDEDIIHQILEAVVEYPEDWKNQIERRTYAVASYGSSYCKPSGSHYSKTNYGGFGSQMTLFGEPDYPDYGMKDEDFSHHGKAYPISKFIEDDIDDDPDTPILDKDDDDYKYEQGLDAATDLLNSIDNPNDFVTMGGVIDGLEQAGLLETFIEAIKKHTNDSEL